MYISQPIVPLSPSQSFSEANSLTFGLWIVDPWEKRKKMKLIKKKGSKGKDAVILSPSPSLMSVTLSMHRQLSLAREYNVIFRLTVIYSCQYVNSRRWHPQSLETGVEAPNLMWPYTYILVSRRIRDLPMNFVAHQFSTSGRGKWRRGTLLQEEIGG